MRRLEITPDDPDGEPLVFDIDYVQLKDFSPSRPASYEAHLTNPRPKGEIVSAGKFGPWRARCAAPDDSSAAITR